MKYKSVFIALFFLFCSLQIFAQEPQKISIDVVEQPLSVILLDLRKDYGFNLAYDEDKIAGFKITLKKIFDSKESTIEALLKGLPLKYEKAGNVFMVIPDETLVRKKEKKQLVNISGFIVDRETFEPLPYSHILINGNQLISDQQGQFSYLVSADTTYSVKISHLGYFIYDTIFHKGLNNKFYLTPSSRELDEVLVKSYQFEKSSMIGEKPGKMKLNHVIAPYLPGYGDNTVYSILRLMPGILASGEQSSDLLVWGSYEGQTKIQLDGFTLFGLKNFNDNIGAVNPLIVKNIEIYKGGYEAKYGDRVGGMVNIIGKNGQMSRPAITLSINNSTINTFFEIPFLKKSSLTAAFRTTYYELYDPAKLNIIGTTRGNIGNIISVGNNSGKGKGKGQGQGQEPEVQPGIKDTLIDLNAQPDYMFMDANLKYTFRGDDGSLFFVSLYGGGDDFVYTVEGDYGNSKLLREEKENNLQKGASAFWGKSWGKRFSNNFSLSYSALQNSSYEYNNITDDLTTVKTDREKTEVENDISEYSFRSENTLTFSKGHYFDFGYGIVRNEISLLRKSFEDVNINLKNQTERFYAYVQDIFPLGQNFEIKSGVRMNYSTTFKKIFAEPRISASLFLEDKWRLNVSCGQYHQFVTKTAVIDSTINYAFFWAVSNNLDIPVIKSNHLIGGLSYINNDFTVSIESFYKKTDGLSRYVNWIENVDKGFYSGNGRSYGLDFYIRKAYKNNLIWLAYTLSKSEEKFSFDLFDIYRPALHDQRHELKLAGILNIKSFYFSANYVYGSGFERVTAIKDDGTFYLPDYSRLDLALVYRFAPKKFNFDAGVSVLNVLNHQNIKYSNLSRVQVDEQSFFNIYSEAVPFSPMLFLKMQF